MGAPRPVGIAIDVCLIAIPTGCGAPMFRDFVRSTPPHFGPMSPNLPISKKFSSFKNPGTQGRRYLALGAMGNPAMRKVAVTCGQKAPMALKTEAPAWRAF